MSYIIEKMGVAVRLEMIPKTRNAHPTSPTSRSLRELLGTGSTVIALLHFCLNCVDYISREDDCPSLRPIPVGGDQLTVERIRGAHAAMRDGDTPEKRLEGVFAMVEDFHEKMNFLQVSTRQSP